MGKGEVIVAGQKPTGSIFGAFKDNISKFAWVGAIITGVVAYLGFRHWIDSEARQETSNLRQITEERDRLLLERNSAATKLAAEEAKNRRIAEDLAASEDYQRLAQIAFEESEDRLKKLNNKLNTTVVEGIAEPGVIVEVDLNAVNTQFNCFIDSANEGEVNQSCYGEQQ
jgi:hypothetical protein